LYGLSEQKDPPLDKEFLSGEKLLLNGRRYRLKVRQGDVPEPTVSFDGQRFDLVGPRSTKMTTREKRQAVVDWYIEEARNQLPERVRKFARKLGVEQVDTEVRDLTRKWGEYRSGGVSLHWRLILAPVRIQNYVVAHELAHSKHGNHSDAFWNTVGSLVPDYEDRREWLRVNGSTLTV
jgi:predicted metal-dependent hydrolase